MKVIISKQLGKCSLSIYCLNYFKFILIYNAQS